MKRSVRKNNTRGSREGRMRRRQRDRKRTENSWMEMCGECEDKN